MTNPFFPEIHGKFGFGCMRFPKLGDEIDRAQVSRMFDVFLDAGLNYFDTAHGYHSGLSETTVKACLTSRYPRDRYLLTDKLTDEFTKLGERFEQRGGQLYQRDEPAMQMIGE